MMYLLFSFVAYIAFGQGTLNDACPVKRPQPMDVFFVLDGSGSIGYQNPSEWPAMLKFVKTIVHESLNVEGDRVGLLSFGSSGYGNNRMHYELGANSTEHIVNTVQGIEQIGGGTPTLGAVELAIEKIITVQPQIEGRIRLMVIITDGHPSLNHRPCYDDELGVPRTSVRDKLDANNIKAVVIGIRNDASKLRCLVEDPDVNIVKITNFHSFDEYRDPTGDKNLLCVDPKELVLECCRVAITDHNNPVIKQTHDMQCRKKSQPGCVNTVGTGMGSCEWGITFEGEFIDGCGVYTHRPTPSFTSAPTSVDELPTASPTVYTIPSLHPTKPYYTLKPSGEVTSIPTVSTFQPTSEPTSYPTLTFCRPINYCVVRGGIKVFVRVKTSSACACSDECRSQGGTEAKWHVMRKTCKCWKSATHIELQQSPYEPNAKHGGNAGGMTQCVKIIGSQAEISLEMPKTQSPTTLQPSLVPTNAPTNSTPLPTSAPTFAKPTPLPTTFKSTFTEEQWQKRCTERKKAMEEWKKQFPYSQCGWVEAICDFRCNGA